MDITNRNLIADFQKFCENHDLSEDKVLQYLQDDRVQKRRDKLIQQAQQNKKLVGQYYRVRVEPRHSMFPEMWRYIQVISEQSSSPYYVECLVFDEYPWYWFKYQEHRIVVDGDYYCGSFEFDGIYVEHIPVSRFTDFKITTYEHWYAALEGYTHRLAQLPWTAEHYRFGGKLPTDPEWARKDEDDGNI